MSAVESSSASRDWGSGCSRWRTWSGLTVGTEWLAVMLTTLRAAESLFPQYGAPTSLLAEQKVNDAPWLNQNEKTSHTRH